MLSIQCNNDSFRLKYIWVKRIRSNVIPIVSDEYYDHVYWLIMYIYIYVWGLLICQRPSYCKSSMKVKLRPMKHCVEWLHFLISVYFNCVLQQRFWLVYLYRPAQISNVCWTHDGTVPTTLFFTILSYYIVYQSLHIVLVYCSIVR